MMHVGVNSWHMRSTSNSPSHQPHHRPPSRLSLAHKRASTIASASIFPILCPRTHLSLRELESVSNSRLFLVERALQAVLHCEAGTRGTSTLCWMNWNDPENSSFPHPAVQHLAPVPLLKT